MEKDRLVRSFDHQQESVEAGLHFVGRFQVSVIGGDVLGALFSYLLLEIPNGVELDIQ